MEVVVLKKQHGQKHNYSRRRPSDEQQPLAAQAVSTGVWMVLQSQQEVKEMRCRISNAKHVNVT